MEIFVERPTTGGVGKVVVVFATVDVPEDPVLELELLVVVPELGVAGAA